MRGDPPQVYLFGPSAETESALSHGREKLTLGMAGWGRWEENGR
ncbi:hypothetical protein [Streptomyces niveus]